VGYDLKRQRIVKKIRGRKSGQAMAGPAGPPTTALWNQLSVERRPSQVLSAQFDR